MKLTFKLVTALIVVIIVTIGIDAYLSVRRESDFLRAELQRKAYRIGNAMKELVADAWRRDGPEIALQLIQAANQRERLLMIRWVWLDSSHGDRFSPQAPSERLNAATQGESVTLQYRTENGTECLLTYVAVRVNDRPGALELTEPLSVVEDFVRGSVYRKLALASFVTVTSLGFMAVVGIWFIGWPLKLLTDKARRAGAGDLTRPLELQTHDELSELAATLNRMCDSLAQSQQRIQEETDRRIATIEQLRHSDRLRTVGQLASGVAHEMGTPLNVVTGRASLISSGRLSPDAIVESAGIIKSQAERMATIIRQLLDFSRTGSSHRVRMNLQTTIRDTTQILEPLSRKRNVQLLVIDNPQPLMACVDPGQIQQVLTNLIVNGIQATDSGGRVTVSAAQERIQPRLDETSASGDFLCLSVVDTGHGIPDDVRARLFEPFVTTKDVGEGTGLGLSIAYGIVCEHGGWIDVQTQVGRGSQFRVYLPVGASNCQAES